MSKEKRYYWLKLKNDFFSQKEIKKLRKIAGGDTFTIIYLKMQLKSLEENGSLYYEGFEDEFAKELALDIDEDPDNVKVTLLYLEKHNLIEKIENKNKNIDEFCLAAVKDNTGTETATAIRVRRHRAKKALPCNTNVTQLKQSVTQLKQIVNGERELELELELEKEREEKEPTFSEIIETLNIDNPGNEVKLTKHGALPVKNELKKYGEYLNVSLNNSEYNKLVNEYGEKTTKQYIEKLSCYMESRGKKYKNYSATIRNWLRGDGVEKQRQETITKFAKYPPQED
jgi:predicted phage replisome organizer